jgi:hypothetical protein
MWPSSIRVKGMPFWLQGWNGTYNVCGETSGDVPVYRLLPYKYLFIFSIIGVSIRRKDGTWVFIRDCDGQAITFHKRGNQDCVFGELVSADGCVVAEICETRHHSELDMVLFAMFAGLVILAALFNA